MPTDALPGALRLFTREEHLANYRRDYELVDTDAETGPGTQPHIDASTLADQLVVLGYNAQVIANGTTDQGSSGTWLDQRGAAVGVRRGDATGGSGFALIGASTGGGNIEEGREIRHKATRLRFKCAITNTYADGDLVPIIGIDTGVATNLDPGEVMEWTNPPVGIYPTATVFQQSDGTGLTGGRDRETNEEYRQSIQRARANPPASGNDAEYQKAVLGVNGIGIQQAFTYPGIKGPGTTGVAFTLRPGRPGAGRIPNAVQRGLVEAALQAQEPGDDGIFMIELFEQLVTVVLRATWSSSATGWADTTPWPTYLTPQVKVKSSPAPAPASFTLYTTAASPPTPAVGSTIGLYNRTTGHFVRKRILSVATSLAVSETRWAITCDTTNNASDTSYAPVAEQLVSPWSDSLDLVAPIVTKLFDGFGPGEQVATFYDPGKRQRRQPESNASWSNQITNRLVSPLFDLTAISDVVLASPSVPFATTIGVPGVEAYMLTLGDFAILKQ